MNLLQVWAELQRRGIALQDAGDELLVDFAGDDLPASLIAALRDHKQSLLAVLRGLPAKSAGAPYDDELIPAGRRWTGLTFGEVRCGLAKDMQVLGMDHAGIRTFTSEVTGRTSLCQLGPAELETINEALDDLEASRVQD